MTKGQIFIVISYPITYVMLLEIILYCTIMLRHNMPTHFRNRIIVKIPSHVILHHINMRTECSTCYLAVHISSVQSYSLVLAMTSHYQDFILLSERCHILFHVLFSSNATSTKFLHHFKV